MSLVGGIMSIRRVFVSRVREYEGGYSFPIIGQRSLLTHSHGLWLSIICDMKIFIANYVNTAILYRGFYDVKTWLSNSTMPIN